ncbi:MAG: hypothetical protein FJ134_11415 [Deltaproteobacteria bacterium]|nr:hypothetical protein [Deltaproteobacteria bacterium]
MRRKTLIIILAIVILGAGAGGGLYFHWLYSPRYSLHQMVLALKSKNMGNIFKYLDSKEIFNNFLEASSRDLPSSNDKERDELTRLGRSLGRKFARLMLPQLFKTYEKEIQATMEKYMATLDNKQLLGLIAAITVAQIKVEGDEAQVSIRDPKTKDDFRFHMRRQEDGVWRIVEVNYQDLKKFLKREFGA